MLDKLIDAIPFGMGEGSLRLVGHMEDWHNE